MFWSIKNFYRANAIHCLKFRKPHDFKVTQSLFLLHRDYSVYFDKELFVGGNGMFLDIFNGKSNLDNSLEIIVRNLWKKLFSRLNNNTDGTNRSVSSLH